MEQVERKETEAGLFEYALFYTLVLDLYVFHIIPKQNRSNKISYISIWKLMYTGENCFE